jgi:hypothetical protein
MKTKQKEFWKEIRHRKWKWIGHILRQDNESTAKKAWSGTRKKEQEKEDT